MSVLVIPCHLTNPSKSERLKTANLYDLTVSMGQECGSETLGGSCSGSFLTAGMLAGLWSLRAPLGWKTSFPEGTLTAVGKRPQSVQIWSLLRQGS